VIFLWTRTALYISRPFWVSYGKPSNFFTSPVLQTQDFYSYSTTNEDVWIDSAPYSHHYLKLPETSGRRGWHYQDFYNMNSTSAKEFVDSNGIDTIVFGPKEKGLSDTIYDAEFNLIFRNNDFSLYRNEAPIQKEIAINQNDQTTEFFFMDEKIVSISCDDITYEIEGDEITIGLFSPSTISFNNEYGNAPTHVWSNNTLYSTMIEMYPIYWKFDKMQYMNNITDFEGIQNTILYNPSVFSNSFRINSSETDINFETSSGKYEFNDPRIETLAYEHEFVSEIALSGPVSLQIKLAEDTFTNSPLSGMVLGAQDQIVLEAEDAVYSGLLPWFKSDYFRSEPCCGQFFYKSPLFANGRGLFGTEGSIDFSLQTETNSTYKIVTRRNQIDIDWQLNGKDIISNSCEGDGLILCEEVSFTSTQPNNSLVGYVDSDEYLLFDFIILEKI